MNRWRNLRRRRHRKKMYRMLYRIMFPIGNQRQSNTSNTWSQHTFSITTNTTKEPVELGTIPLLEEELVVGYRYGYRVWNMIPNTFNFDSPDPSHESVMGLWSTGVNYSWKLGKNKARCKGGKTHHSEPPPGVSCMCGFWGIYEYMSMPILPNDGYVMGKIRTWGKVVEAQYGFRAEYAEVVELYTDGIESGLGHEARVSAAKYFGVPLLNGPFTCNRLCIGSHLERCYLYESL